MLRKIDCVMIRVEDVSDPTAEAGACDEHAQC
jgi:hypothetical protein